MKAYPNYKDSGVPWLGEVPEHWQVRPGLFMFKEKQVKNKGLIEKQVLSLSYGKIIIKPEEKLRGLVPESFETYQIVEPGDIIIRSTDMQNDHTSLRTGLVNNKGIITSAYICLNSLDYKFSRFNHWLLHGLDLIKVFYGLGSGLRQNLSWSDFKRLPLPIPTLVEQQQIARYLDWLTAKINKFINAKKKLIALLKEQKQIIINEAVTKGLNPNVLMKDSGVEWLGDIPAHWEVRRLKQVVCFNPSKNENVKTAAPEDSIVFLPMEKISVEGIIDCSLKVALKQISEGFTYFAKGDVIIAKITPCFENGKGAFLSELETDFGFGTTELFVLRPLKNINGMFLRYLSSSRKFLELGEQHMSGAAGQQRVQSGFLKNYELGLPSIQEQLNIVEFLKKETTLIDKTITRTEREIELIQEYRTRLVSDIVTGKVDVRSVAVPDFEAVEEEIDTQDDAVSEDELIMEDSEE